MDTTKQFLLFAFTTVLLTTSIFLGVQSVIDTPSRELETNELPTSGEISPDAYLPTLFIFLRLQIDGNDIEGECTIASLEREGTIPVYYYSDGMQGSTISSKPKMDPVVFSKKVSKTSPILFKALTENAPVTFAEFRFYRPSTDGSGSEEFYFSVTLENVAFGYMRQYSASFDLTSYFMEELVFVYNENSVVTLTEQITGATHTFVPYGQA